MVSENSGIAEVIRDAGLVNHMDVSQSVIPMVGDAKAVGRRFADAALEILVHEQRAASFCNMLSERLLPICSWDVGAQQLLTAIDEAAAGRASGPPPRSQVASHKRAVVHDALGVLNANRALISDLPGLLTIGIQEAIVVTFERGRIPVDFPAEIAGIPLVAREGDTIQQTASVDDSVGNVLVDGTPIGTATLFAGPAKRTLALTAAHVVGLSSENLTVRVRSEVFPAHVEKINSEADWALLSLPFIKSVRPIGRIGDPVPGQTVQLRVSDSLISGTISAVEIMARLGTRTYNGLFGVTTLREVPPGSSGALIVSDDGSALGMLVAGARGGGTRESLFFAIPLRSITEEPGVQLFESESAQHIAAIPTDEMSLQHLLKSLDNVERFAHHGRPYFRGWLDGALGIVIAPVPRIGNIGAAAAATALLLDNDIAKIFVVGLCGGLNAQRQVLGDVVISSDVIYYEPGVVGPSGTRQRLRILERHLLPF